MQILLKFKIVKLELKDMNSRLKAKDKVKNSTLFKLKYNKKKILFLKLLSRGTPITSLFVVDVPLRYHSVCALVTTSTTIEATGASDSSTQVPHS